MVMNVTEVHTIRGILALTVWKPKVADNVRIRQIICVQILSELSRYGSKCNIFQNSL